MSPSPQLAPAGSSTYSSGTMYVGDGTWDSSRNTFLLPNLVGLNFETMRYNGMGNRFKDMPGYRQTVRGHGIVAAITFLLIVPAAIMIARFYHRSPVLALRLHIWLHILTVALTTVAFILGWIAVGPARSLSNPHHGIGLAIYVLILVQAIGGCIIHRREKGKQRYRIPLRLYLHELLGRTIAVLGIVQVALGLTLYGSPKYLFVLYALWGFTLMFTYFTLTFRNRPQTGFDDGSSYYSGYKSEVTEERRSHRHRTGLGALAAAGAAGAGLAALRRSRSRRHSRDGTATSRTSSPSRHHRTSVTEEKLHDEHETRHTWRDRILGAATGIGVLAAAKSFFDRRRGHDRESDAGSYRPPVAGASEVSQTDLSRVEEGLAPSSPGRDHWRRAEERESAQAAAVAAGSPSRRPARRRRSGSFSSYTSISGEHGRHEGHGVRDGIMALGLATYLRSKFKQRRKRKEDARVEEMRRQEIEQERLARTNSERRKYTGDGTPRRSGRRNSASVTESSIQGGRTNPDTAHTEPPLNPPPPPIPPELLRRESGSEDYASTGGRHHRRHHLGEAAAAATAAGALAGAAASRRDANRHRNSADTGVDSPPVSIKVKVHNDGRHVTLRRLNEEEAAAEREAKRRERHRRNRSGSLSSVGEDGADRWRRAEAAQPGQSSSAAAPIPMPPPPPAAAAPHGIPPPPPIPESAVAGSVGSPGTTPYDTGTEMSRPSTYDANRRRRRAERSAAQRAKGGNRVEFE